jgi:hypothetical protein
MSVYNPSGYHDLSIAVENDPTFGPVKQVWSLPNPPLLAHAHLLALLAQSGEGWISGTLATGLTLSGLVRTGGDNQPADKARL